MSVQVDQPRNDELARGVEDAIGARRRNVAFDGLDDAVADADVALAAQLLARVEDFATLDHEIELVVRSHRRVCEACTQARGRRRAGQRARAAQPVPSMLLHGLLRWLLFSHGERRARCSFQAAAGGVKAHAPAHTGYPARMQRSASAPRVEPGALEFDAEGSARSPRYGDVYASRDGALGQAQHVFLAGNGLPQRWDPLRPFTILETGFGLGTNFLATWQAWRAAPQRCARLHYVAVERHPLAAGDLERAVPHALHALLAPLVAQWPEAIGGLHRLAFDDERVVLTLALGDATTLVPQLVAGVDAFYLDGFAPERNPEMWSPALLRAAARLALPGATLASWCTARSVRDALETAGFELELLPGFGRKRHMLRGRYAPRWTVRRHEPPAPYAGERRALVIGAGLAGALAAAALARRDWSVTVVDAASAPAQGTSALPWGVLHPHVSRDDNRASRLERAGFRVARQALARSDAAQRGHWRACGVFELAADLAPDEAERLLREQGLPPALVCWLDAAQAAVRIGVLPRTGGWWYGQGGIVAMRAWCDDLLAHPRIRFLGGSAVASLEHSAEGSAAGWTARCVAPGGEALTAPVVVVAAARDAARLLGARQLPLQAIGGRVSRVSPVPRSCPFARGARG